MVQHRDRFRRGVTFTILGFSGSISVRLNIDEKIVRFNLREKFKTLKASISKYFFYLALADDLNYAEKDPEQKMWRTGTVDICLSVCVLFQFLINLTN